MGKIPVPEIFIIMKNIKYGRTYQLFRPDPRHVLSLRIRFLRLHIFHIFMLSQVKNLSARVSVIMMQLFSLKFLKNFQICIDKFGLSE